jgi:hypothetical protein
MDRSFLTSLIFSPRRSKILSFKAKRSLGDRMKSRNLRASGLALASRAIGYSIFEWLSSGNFQTLYGMSACGNPCCDVCK